MKKAIPRSFEVDHLHRVNEDMNNKWKYPSDEDIQNVAKKQTLQCTVEDACDTTPDSRKRYFTLNNAKQREREREKEREREREREKEKHFSKHFY